jgi:predicted MFS family arabinose efflux permease
VTPSRPERARLAVAAAFALNGLAFGSWVSRVPAVRDGLELSPAQLGLLLLCPGVGHLVGLPAAGWLVARAGPARTVLAGATGVALALGGVVAGLVTGLPLLAAAGLVLYGLGVSGWDVAMNVEGADVERRLARPLMPRLHAGFSLGSVAGAGAGAAAAAAGLAVVAQLLVTAAVVPAAAAAATRGFLPATPPPDRARARRSGVGLRRAWREPRTLLVGVLVLAFAFAEGVANDWLALALVDGHGAGEALGAAGYGVFVAALTGGRLTGGALLERTGRVAALRALATTAAAGVLLVVLADPLPLVLLGALLWGAGVSLGFPVGMSAAADEPAAAPARVAVVSSIGYTAFFAGPPLVGMLADANGVLTALLVVPGALLVGALTAAATRPLSSVAVSGG